MKYQEKKANLAKVKEHLSAYVAEVVRGTEVTICRHNRPVAKIIPIADTPSENRTRLGSEAGSVVIKCDLTEPAIPESDWHMLA